MISKRLHFGAVCLLALAGPAGADGAGTDTTPNEDATVVVTATRTSAPLEQVASSVTVITARQLQATHQPFIADALREVPGLYVAQSGGPGQAASVFLRGAAASDTLVLIDGMPVNDTSSPTRAYDFANLTVDNVERIEILRGPQSTLYGSDALAGVINILTRRGHGAPKSSVSFDGGRYATATGRIGSSGSVKNFDYSATASRYVSNGFPLADLQSGDTHNDGYRNTTFSARADGRLSDALSLRLSGRLSRASATLAAFPPPDFALTDEGTHTSETGQRTFRAEAHLSPAKSRLENIFGVSAATTDRNYFDLDTGAGQVPSVSDFHGKTTRIDWQANYTADARNLVTVGAEREEDQARYTSPGDSSPTRHVWNTGLYVQDQLTLRPRWFVTLGARSDNFEPFGAKGTYRLTSSFQPSATGPRLKATYGTGFKAPSLFDLYDPTYGNAGLRPEESRSYDAGIEQAFDRGRGAVSATYFHNDYHNLIGFDQNFVAQNIETARARGVELVASFAPLTRFHADLSYTHTRSEGTGGKPLPRRPGNLYAATLGYRLTSRADLSLNGVCVGRRLDTAAFPAATLPAYTLLNLALTVTVSPGSRAFVRVDNLLDRRYEDVYAYRTARRAVYTGLTTSF